MTARCPLPARASVRDLLTDLLDRRVTVTKGALQTLSDERPSLAATYLRDDGTPAATAVCDLPLANATGAAIGMVPPAEAAQELATGRLDGDLAEFFQEVVNIFAKLLNSPSTPHVRLVDVLPVPGRVPAGVAGILRGPAERADYDVTVDGYSAGKLTVLLG